MEPRTLGCKHRNCGSKPQLKKSLLNAYRGRTLNVGYGLAWGFRTLWMRILSRDGSSGYLTHTLS
eukprot:314694-Prymnesium_polylepis.1